MNFIDDKEKMNDFDKLSKHEFLASYSYITEKEYNETKKLVKINKMKNDIEKYLKNSEDYADYTINYILIDKKDPENTIVVASRYDEMIEINPSSYEINRIMDWAYSIDEDVFRNLEQTNEIGYMSFECHYGVWCVINEYAPEDIKYKKGMQKYLKYCKDNGITKEKIEKENNLDVLDVMEHYKPEKNKTRER